MFVKDKQEWTVGLAQLRGADIVRGKNIAGGANVGGAAAGLLLAGTVGAVGGALLSKGHYLGLSYLARNGKTETMTFQLTNGRAKEFGRCIVSRYRDEIAGDDMERHRL